ncbi:MAG: RNB domain-containing ribonuclease [Planctomycetes bacterium]|nr:RNB domain-containing ribonuclease [Planctomycetota bacterium]
MKDDDRKKKGFKSFKDLAGKKEPEPVTPKSGWTFEGEENPADQERPELPAGATARERIARRPRAFGPMQFGPPHYRDDGSEEMQLFASHRVRTVFPSDVEREVGTLPQDPIEADFVGRLDLRRETIFTIDGDDAKDYDDAIAIRPLEAGAYEVGVHIADVSHYVRPGTALDDEALTRGTSVYVADQVVPMLPEAISNHLCSLVEARPRLAYSVTMRFEANGKRSEYTVAKSVIQSVKRCTYRAVQELLDGKDTPEARALAHLKEPLEHFRKWTNVQQKLREARGALKLESRERKFVFDAQWNVVKVVDYPRYFSNLLIEETALAANQAVGDFFRARGLPTIYRVHPEKDPEEIEAVAKMLAEHGILVPQKERLTGRDIGRMIRSARKKPNAEALTQRIMGLIERAVYEVHDHEDVAKHFGLAREAYLHFTSPIRRYPDLVVHRWLHQLQSRGADAAAELKTEEFLHDLNEVALHCSGQAELAEMAETAVGDLKICQFMEPHIGEKIAAKVLRVSPAGIELQLLDFNVTGFLPAKTIGERSEVKGPTIVIRVGRNVKSFTEGHPIAVRLKDVDFLRLQLLFELA